jgi:Flp pilus assembly pilin Flp
MEQVKRFIRDEQGLETVEYAVILGLIVVATIGVVTALSGAVQNKFTTVTNTLK